MSHLYILSTLMQTISSLPEFINTTIFAVNYNILAHSANCTMIYTKQTPLMVQYMHSCFLWFFLFCWLYFWSITLFVSMIVFRVIFIHSQAIILSTCHCKDCFVTMTMKQSRIKISSCNNLQSPLTVNKVRCILLLFTSTAMSLSRCGRFLTIRHSVSHWDSQYSLSTTHYPLSSIYEFHTLLAWSFIYAYNFNKTTPVSS